MGYRSTAKTTYVWSCDPFFSYHIHVYQNGGILPFWGWVGEGRCKHGALVDTQSADYSSWMELAMSVWHKLLLSGRGLGGVCDHINQSSSHIIKVKLVVKAYCGEPGQACRAIASGCGRAYIAQVSTWGLSWKSTWSINRTMSLCNFSAPMSKSSSSSLVGRAAKSLSL